MFRTPDLGDRNFDEDKRCQDGSENVTFINISTCACKCFNADVLPLNVLAAQRNY